MFNKILFPIDNSRETSHAISLVADLAQRYTSTLILLSVLDDSSISSAEIEKSGELVQNLLQQTESALHQIGIQSTKTDMRKGKTAFVVCDVADEMNVDLIVMGCRGLGLMGDGDKETMDRVINLAPCPVLVVP